MREVARGLAVSVVRVGSRQELRASTRGRRGDDFCFDLVRKIKGHPDSRVPA